MVQFQNISYKYYRNCKHDCTVMYCKFAEDGGTRVKDIRTARDSVLDVFAEIKGTIIPVLSNGLLCRKSTTNLLTDVRSIHTLHSHLPSYPIHFSYSGCWFRIRAITKNYLINDLPWHLFIPQLFRAQGCHRHRRRYAPSPRPSRPLSFVLWTFRPPNMPNSRVRRSMTDCALRNIDRPTSTASRRHMTPNHCLVMSKFFLQHLLQQQFPFDQLFHPVIIMIHTRSNTLSATCLSLLNYNDNGVQYPSNLYYYKGGWCGWCDWCNRISRGDGGGGRGCCCYWSTGGGRSRIGKYALVRTVATCMGISNLKQKEQWSQQLYFCKLLLSSHRSSFTFSHDAR